MADFFVEKFNASDDNFLVTDIYKTIGDYVKKGEILFSIESSKASIDIEADIEGFIYYKVNKGDKINVNEYFYSINDTHQLTDITKIIQDVEVEKLVDESIFISSKAQILLTKNNIKAQDLELDIINSNDVLRYISESKYKFIPQDYLNIPNKEKYVIIIGAKGGGKMCIDAISNIEKFEILGLLDDSTKERYLYGYPILGGTDLVKKFIEIGFNKFVLAFGVIDHRNIRMDLFNKMIKWGAEFPNILHPKSIVEQSVTMGQGNIILAGANVGSSVKLGNLNYINNNALVSHDCSISNNVHIAPGAVLASNISVKDNSLIGMNTTLFFGIKIGFNVVINNGVNLNFDVRDNSVIK